MNKIYFKSSFNSIIIDNMGVKVNSEKIAWNKINSIRIYIVSQESIGGVYFTITLKSGVKFLTDSRSVKLVDYFWISKNTEKRILEFAHELKEYYSYQESVHRMSIRHLSKDLSRFRKSRNGFIKLIVFLILFIVVHKLTMSSFDSFTKYGEKHNIDTSGMVWSNGTPCSGHVRLKRKVNEELIYERYCGFMGNWYRYYQDRVRIPRPEIREDNVTIINPDIIVINNLEYQVKPLKAKVSWYEAERSCDGLNLYGDGWRLPTLNELERISNIYLCDRLFESHCIESINLWWDLNKDNRVKGIEQGVNLFIKKDFSHLHKKYLFQFWTSEYAQSHWHRPSHRDNPENVMYVLNFQFGEISTANKNEDDFNSVICVRDDLKQGLSNEK